MLARSHGQWSRTVCSQVLQPYRANPPRWRYKTSKKSDTGPQKRAVRAAYSLPPFKKIVLIKRRFQERFVGGTCVADEAAWKKNRRVPLLLFSGFWCVSNPVWGMPEYSRHSSLSTASGCIWCLGTSRRIVLLWWLWVVKSLHNSPQPSLIWK